MSEAANWHETTKSVERFGTGRQCLTDPVHRSVRDLCRDVNRLRCLQALQRHEARQADQSTTTPCLARCEPRMKQCQRMYRVHLTTATQWHTTGVGEDILADTASQSSPQTHSTGGGVELACGYDNHRHARTFGCTRSPSADCTGTPRLTWDDAKT